ncbi:hypothetical protein [Marinactinospora rubrisoli]|uniref:Uncharacterized protein n=1 Tax=Marinactinospora rubrisoli TaxID=2715399 RepID=A0ABW2KDI2_9ACTN
MARKLSEAPQSTRSAPSRRRRTPAFRRGAARVPVRPVASEPRPVAAPTPQPSELDRPLLSWVLTTGPDGRTRPEAHWS